MKEQLNDLQKFYKWGFWTSLITICLFIDTCRVITGHISPDITLDFSAVSLVELTKFVILAAVVAGISVTINFIFSFLYVQFRYWLKDKMKSFGDAGVVHSRNGLEGRSSPEKIIKISIKENNLPLYQYAEAFKADLEKKEHGKFVMNFLFFFLMVNFYIKGTTYDITLGRLVLLPTAEVKQLMWIQYLFYAGLLWCYLHAVTKRFEGPVSDEWIKESNIF